MPVKPERTELELPFRRERHAASRFRIIEVTGKNLNAPLGPRSSGRERRGRGIAQGIRLTGESRLARLGADGFYRVPASNSGRSAVERFVACLEGLEDPRRGNAGRHDFYELLIMALCAVLCGGQSAVDMALFVRSKEPLLRGFLELKNGLPSHDTFSRLFRLLDPEQFRTTFQRFMVRFSEAVQGVVAIDGKVLRRSFDRASGKSPLHMVSAWGCEQRLVLAQIATDAKSNEITAVPKLLEMLSLKGTIVTTDALNCQRDIAQQIVDQGGDYALALKGNQGTLLDDVSTYFDDPASKTTTAKPVVDGDHGRIETRTATVCTDIDWLEDHRWPGLTAIGKVVRTRETTTKTTTETAYYLLSSALSPERCNEIVRSHWGVENRLHWRLDVVMNEDQDRTRLDNGPHNLAVLRHMALNVMQKDTTKGSLRTKFMRAGWDEAYLARLDEAYLARLLALF